MLHIVCHVFTVFCAQDGQSSLESYFTVEFASKTNAVTYQIYLVCQLSPKLAFVYQTTGSPEPNNLRSILCEGTHLDQYVRFSNRAEREAFQNVSCSLAPQQLINTQQVLLQNLDARKTLSEVSCPRRRLHVTTKSHNVSKLN